jgi:hypothetical protein
LIQIDIGARVQHKQHAGIQCGFADGANFFQLPRKINQRTLRVTGSILKIDADGARFDHLARGSGSILWTTSISGFHVCGDRNFNRAGDASDACQHLLGRDFLPIRIAQRKSNSGAGCGYGPESSFLNDAGAGYVPDVRQQQGFRPTMHLPKGTGFAFLFFKTRHQFPYSSVFGEIFLSSRPPG